MTKILKHTNLPSPSTPCIFFIILIFTTTQIVFEYSPSSLEAVESLWTFSIPSICLSHPFLLVGRTEEPSVNLDRAYVTFKAMLIGKSNRSKSSFWHISIYLHAIHMSITYTIYCIYLLHYSEYLFCV